MSIKNFKDEFWFSHASDAKDDPKCMLLIEQLGLEGYGIFWVLVEVLRQQKNYKYPIALLAPLSRKYNTTQAKMEVVVKEYGLFEIDDSSFFFSYSLNRRMEALELAKEKKRLAGVKSGQSRRKKKNEQCSNSVQTMLEHRTNGSELTYHNITYNSIDILDDDEKKQILTDISKMTTEEYNIILLDYIYSVYGDNIRNLDGLKNKIHNQINNHDSATLQGINKIIIQNELTTIKALQKEAQC